jgi:protein CMS1
MASATDKTAKSGGDDLDDGLELDPELLAPSDDEGDVGDNDSDADIGDEETRIARDDDEDEEDGVEVGEKRKRDEVDEDEEERLAEKRRRKKEKLKERKAKVSRFPGTCTIMLMLKKSARQSKTESSTPATHLNPAQFTELLLTSIRETFPSSSPMEIDDMLLPQDILLSAPQFAAPENTPDGTMAAMKKRIEGLVKSSKNSDNGTPRVIVLCLSGIRCADVARELRSIKGKGEVAKVSKRPHGDTKQLTLSALRKAHEGARAS